MAEIRESLRLMATKILEMMWIIQQRILGVGAPNSEQANHLEGIDEVVAPGTSMNDVPLSFPNLSNRLVPICRLPPELLHAIFTFCCTSTDRKEAAYILSHVCHHWRVAAMSYPWLWSEITTSVPKSLQQCLELSGTHPLALFLPHNSSYDRPTPCKNHNWTVKTCRSIMSQISFHSSRIQLIHIRVPDTHLEDVLDLFNFPVPQLEELMLVDYGDLGFVPHDGMWLEGLPSLRSLKMEYVHSWPPKLFVNLTRVCLTFPPGIKSISFVFFTHFLEQSPFLQSLTLQNCHPEPLVLPISPVPLRSLTDLELGYCKSGPILSHISVPENIKFSISDFQSYPNFGAALPQDTSNMAFVQCLESISIGLQVGGPRYRSYVCGYSAYDSSDDGPSFSSSSPREVDDALDCQFLTAVLNGLSTLPLPKLRSMYITGYLDDDSSKRIPTTSAEKLYRNIPSLESLDLDDPQLCRKVVVEPLTACAELCPNLKRIYVWIATTTYEEMFELLCNLARSRIKAGHLELKVMPGILEIDEQDDVLLKEMWEGLCKEHSMENFRFCDIS